MLKITSFHLKTARAAAGLSLDDIAAKTGVSRRTIVNAEGFGNFGVITNIVAGNLQKLVDFYEKEYGVEFLGDANNPGIIMHNRVISDNN